MKKRIFVYMFVSSSCVTLINIALNHENKYACSSASRNTLACKMPVHPKFYGQCREDEALFEHFFKFPVKCNGVIVEMGASDGAKNSNSKFFEDQLGWYSILIEPNTQHFKELIRNRPHSQKYNFVLCSEEKVDFEDLKSASNIGTFMYRNQTESWTANNVNPISAPCSRLEHLLKGLIHIDIFILDVEGGELDALLTMNWNTTVDYWVIKLDSANPYKNQAVRDILASKGYIQSELHNPIAYEKKRKSCSLNELFMRDSIRKKVVSYCLFGRNSRYTDGAIANAKLVQNIYPGWEMYIYYDSTICEYTVNELRKFRYVKLIDMTNSPFINKIAWRLLVAADKNVRRYVIRDIDSRLSKREKAAVDEWIKSGYKFHVMRDHPLHLNYAMQAGMWGGTHEAIPHMKYLLQNELGKTSYKAALNFLNYVVWNIALSSVYQHDSFSNGQYGEEHSFPTKRVGFEYVGSSFVNGKMIQRDISVLQKAIFLSHYTKFNGRTILTSNFDKYSTRIHQTNSQRLFNLYNYRSIRKQCSKLNSNIFLECKQEATPEWVQQYQPCSNYAFIRFIKNGYISDNSVHKDVPGTVFTDTHIFKWQAYVRDVPVGHPSGWKKPPTVYNYECLGTVLQAYPTALGHFPHEVLPRLVYLFDHIPEHCPILTAVTDFVQRYIDVLSFKQRQRVLKWKGFGYIYFSKKLYVANEGPYCSLNNPHSGGMSTFFQPALLQRVREVFVRNGQTVKTNTNQTTVVIKRNMRSRSYSEHDSLVQQLRKVREHVYVFDGSGTLQEHIKLFESANIVIGPHGAGFSNLIFCSPGTLVIEIGWDSTQQMEMDNMYSRVSAAMGLEYRLLIGKGSYKGPISLNPLKVLSEIQNVRA